MVRSGARPKLLGKIVEICDPPPALKALVDAEDSEAFRRASHDLQEALRPIAPRAVQGCGVIMIPAREGSDGPAGRFVDVMTRATDRGERAHFHGLVRCACWHSCASCSPVIRSARAEEVRQAVAWWRDQGGDVELLTLTFAHRATDDPRELIEGRRAIWRKLFAGNPGKRLRKRLALYHYVRGSDETYGLNGLHPHIHVVLFTRRGERNRRAVAMLKLRWAAAVRSVLGRSRIPSAKNGVDLRASKRDDYLAKLGLEVTHSATKKGKRGGRNPWAVARSAADGDHDDIVRWTKYSRGMRGEHHLSWSHKLRDMAGITARTDQQIVDNEDGDAVETHVASIPAELFAQVAWSRGLRYAVKRGAETSGRMGVAIALGLHLWGLAPPEEGEPPDPLQLELFAAIAPFDFPAREEMLQAA